MASPDPSSKPTTETRKTLPLRERLLDAAMDLLEHDGPEALTLRSLAAATGVSHMAPYRHFRDKEALLAALAERGFMALGQAMQAAGARRQASGESPRSAFLGFGVAYLDFARARPQLYRLMFGPALAGKAEHAGLVAAAAATFDGLLRAVGEVIPPEDPFPTETHAVATWSMVHGLALLLLDRRLAVPAGSAAETALIDQVLRLHGRSFNAPAPG